MNKGHIQSERAEITGEAVQPQDRVTPERSITRQYFDACDKLDEARLHGNPPLIADLQAQVDELVIKARWALETERKEIRARFDSMFDDMVRAFLPRNPH